MFRELYRLYNTGDENGTIRSNLVRMALVLFVTTFPDANPRLVVVAVRVEEVVFLCSSSVGVVFVVLVSVGLCCFCFLFEYLGRLVLVLRLQRRLVLLEVHVGRGRLVDRCRRRRCEAEEYGVVIPLWSSPSS